MTKTQTSTETPMCKCGRAAIDPIHDNPGTYRPFAHAVDARD